MWLIDRFQKKSEPVGPVQAPGKAEISLVDPLLYPSSGVWTAYNPDVFAMRKGGLYLYDKMRRDEQIKVCQWIKRLAVLCSGWDVDPVSDDPVDVEAAEFVKDVFKRLRGTFDEKVKNILSGMDFGYSITEKVWGYIEDGDFRGRIGLKALKTRKPHEWDFDADEYGNLRKKGLWQLNGQYKYDPAKFVVYTHGREFDNWYGMSDLQAAYRAWWSKDIIIRFWNTFLEKYGMGIPLLKPKEGKKIDEPMYTTLKNALNNLQATSALSWQEDTIDLSLLESTRRGKETYESAIQLHDRAIARALFSPTGLGFQDESAPGSLARSGKHMEVWLWVMMDLRRITEEVINEQIVPEMVGYNYEVGESPRFKFIPIDGDEIKDLTEMWLKALDGQHVHPDAGDELHLRKILKFPERDREELEEEIEADKVPVVPEIPGEFPEFSRELTRFEKRVDFRGIEKRLDTVEAEEQIRLTGILERQRDDFLIRFEREAKKQNINAKWINNLGLKYGVEFQGSVRAFMGTVFEMGRRDATAEIGKAKKRKRSYIAKVKPEEVIRMLEKTAFWIKNVMWESITKDIQALLINMLETGESPGETAMKIRKIYDPYIGDEQVVVDQKQIEPYRIEVVVRNNSTKAYCNARVAEYRDPELDGFVRAVQLSAILDTRTTAICRSVDGDIIMLDDPLLDRLTPPLHHQCRTIPVSVTVIDGPFEPTKQVDLHGVLDLAPASFGGNVDK